MADENTTQNEAAENTAAAAPKSGLKRFSEEQITEIRRLRALKGENGKAQYSHAALAKQFDTKPGVISHIVRNLTYQDPNYVPVNDNVIGA